MSILIRGMEMPTSCGYCRFCSGQANTDYGVCAWCEVDGKARDAYTRQDCPLVPVPPHGRLIDGDKLNDYLKTAAIMADGEAKDAYIDARAEAKTMPTIIPAEEGAKTEEDSEPWLCLSCRHYPPSSTDGKPCSQCNPNEVWHSCYDPAEEGE